MKITHDFFGLRMAVETSSGPGWGGAPLGSAMVVVVVDELARCRETRDTRPHIGHKHRQTQHVFLQHSRFSWAPRLIEGPPLSRLALC